MKIRSITMGQNIPYSEVMSSFTNNIAEIINPSSEFCDELVEEFDKVGLEVESRRICTQPLISDIKNRYSFNTIDNASMITEKIRFLQEQCKKAKFTYFSSCMILADRMKDVSNFESVLTSEIPNSLEELDDFFSSILVSSTTEGINLKALKYCSKIIKRLSIPDPFNNLKFCMSSNVKADTPFFPAAYHFSESPKFSLALEMADEVVKIFDNYTSLNNLKENLKKKFNDIYEPLVETCNRVSRKLKIEFYGIDFSPAPFPTYERSIGTAIEQLNFNHFGIYGSLLGVGLIKSCIPKKEKVIGFSGFMQPVLEDFTISKRVHEGKVSMESLLLYSAICGTGLDCIPLPGNITERELFYILLDVCSLSLALNKPLTARLMPITGKSPGDEVDFDFEYFAKSKVLNIQKLAENKKNDLFYRDEDLINLYK